MNPGLASMPILNMPSAMGQLWSTVILIIIDPTPIIVAIVDDVLLRFRA